MKRALALSLLLAACRGEHAVQTSTIAPAHPRPDTSVELPVRDVPSVSTAGSPVPAAAPAPGTQFVEIDATGLSIPKLVPVGQTAFVIRNRTGVDHELALQSATGTQGSVRIAAGGDAVLQGRLTGPTYALVCIVEGHREHATFGTYVPGTPLNATKRTQRP